MDERRVIARMHEKKISQAEIARTLRRDRSAAFGEIKRNMFVDKFVSDLHGHYCVTAHEIACKRGAKLRKLIRFSNVGRS